MTYEVGGCDALPGTAFVLFRVAQRGAGALGPRLLALLLALPMLALLTSSSSMEATVSRIARMR
jgi:hypothetical protein